MKEDIFKTEIDEDSLKYNEYTDAQIKQAIDELDFDDETLEKVKALWSQNLDYLCISLALSERMWICAEEDVVSIPDIRALYRQVREYSEWTASILKALDKDFKRHILN